jgi:hypothetical protein
MDNVGLKIGLWGTLSFMVTLTKKILDAILYTESMGVGTYHSHRVPKSYVSSVTWMPTWHYLKVKLGTFANSWVEQEAQSRGFFA